jgi:RHS repeat-associated protein
LARSIRGIGLIAADGLPGYTGRQFYLYNAHGSVVQLTDVSGAVTRQYAYDAFGNERKPGPNIETETLIYAEYDYTAEHSSPIVGITFIWGPNGERISQPVFASSSIRETQHIIPLTGMPGGTYTIDVSADGSPGSEATLQVAVQGSVLHSITFTGGENRTLSFPYNGNGGELIYAVKLDVKGPGTSAGTASVSISNLRINTGTQIDIPDTITSRNPHISTPFGYSGEYLDCESGLIYLRARYYDPAAGRFISADPYWHPGNMIYGTEQPIEKEIIINDDESIHGNFFSPRFSYDNTSKASSALSEMRVFEKDGVRIVDIRANPKHDFIRVHLERSLSNDLPQSILNNVEIEVRHIQRKPDMLAIQQSTNLYVYCLNNPVMYEDPSGEIAKVLIPVILPFVPKIQNWASNWRGPVLGNTLRHTWENWLKPHMWVPHPNELR